MKSKTFVGLVVVETIAFLIAIIHIYFFSRVGEEIIPIIVLVVFFHWAFVLAEWKGWFD